MGQPSVIVIGAGIIGLASAYQLLQRDPNRSIILLEKELESGVHQTGHNSGVLHSGVYYKPGSLKATNCRIGKAMMERFCEEHSIPFERCGKIIVANSEQERSRLKYLLERAQANNVEARIIDKAQMQEIEPHVNGLAALHVPEAGIVNYRAVCRTLASIITNHPHAHIHYGQRVQRIENFASETVVFTQDGSFTAHKLVNCAGLYCDKIATAAGHVPQSQIVPFRGEYFELKPTKRHLCKHLIYPVPNPDFPFLGVHFTRMIDGSVECGPNAVLAFRREGYRKRDIHLGELWESLSYPGFRKLAGKYWDEGMMEVKRSVFKSAFVKSLQTLIPDIQANDIISAPAGVRAQALRPDGTLVDDFEIIDTKHELHVLNAPSPAATSSLSIGDTIAQRLHA